MKTYFNTLTLGSRSLVLATALSLFSCNNSENHEIGIVSDQSLSHDHFSIPDINDFKKKVLTELGLPHDTTTSNGVNFYFTYMGSSFIAPVKSVGFPARKMMLFSSLDRAAEVKECIHQFHLNTDELLTTQPSDMQSNLYRGICNTLENMDHNASTRKIIAITDGLESSNIANMELYYDNPTQLMSDYDSLKAKFLKSEPLLPEYAGTEIVFLCPDKDHLVYEAAKNFWSKIFEEHKMAFTVRSMY